MKKGCIHFYIGNGKGKTTAAVGLALRAASHHLKVAYLEFHKNRGKWGPGETELLEKNGVTVCRFACESPIFNSGLDPEKLRQECLKGIEHIRIFFKDGRYNLIILDEILHSVSLNLIHEEELLDLLKNKPGDMDIVLTGREASPRLMETANLITEMKEIKHYFSKGVSCKKGIEY